MGFGAPDLGPDSGWRDNDIFVFLALDYFSRRDGRVTDGLPITEEERNTVGIRVERAPLGSGRKLEVV